MVTYTAAFLAAANLLAIAHAAPAQPVCSVAVTVITGSPIWVPRPDPTSSSSWSAWVDPTSTTTTTSSWGEWTSVSSGKYSSSSTTWTTTNKPTTYTTDKKTTDTTKSTYSTPSPITTPSTTFTYTTPSTTFTYTTPSTTFTHTTPTTTFSKTTTTTTTTTSQKPTATCSNNSYKFNAQPAGSCACEFDVYCNYHSSPTSYNFWERKDSELIGSLEQCLEICNDNSACKAAIWSASDPSDTQDYMRCWQTDALPGPDSTGFGQLQYKGACSSSCSKSYSTSG